ncbi:ATP-binding protein [Luteococcus sp. Sow4_B9]|uniref:sensor histidine kinase n=1 Tax=Luteococcus sp. Sow4_B9 TaxID=3438792 RepID=UPI003F97371B
MSPWASDAPSQPATPRWTIAASEGLRTLVLLAMPFQLVFSIGPLLAQIGSLPWTARAGVVVLLVSQCVMLTVVLHRRHGLTSWFLQATTLGAAHLLLTTGRMVMVPGDVWGPGYWAAPLVVSTMLVERRQLRRRLLFALVAGLASVEILGFLLWWQMSPARLADEIFVVYPIVILLSFSLGLISMAEEHDATAARTEKARSTQRHQQAETEARREAERLLHDHVLHALHAIAAERSHVSAQDASQECRDAIRILDSPKQGLVALRTLLAEDPVTQRVRAVLVGDGEPLPRAVATALAAATHEALVNVERHAAAEHCTIELQSWGTAGCRVSIVDDGRGFDPDSRHKRLGLQSSVIEHLDDIGGHASISSRPGEGTRIDLEWPRQDAPRQAPTPADSTSQGPTAQEPTMAHVGTPSQLPSPAADARTRRLMVATAIPALVSCGLVMALVGSRSDALSTVLPATVAALLVGAWGAARLLRGPLSRSETLLILGVALVAWLVNLVLVPSPPTDIYDLWMTWGATGLVQLAMFSRPRRNAAMIGVGFTAVIVVGTVLRFGIVDTVTVMGGGAALAIVVVLAGHHALAWACQLATDMAQQMHARQATQDATARMHQSDRVEQFWSQRVTQDVLPLIRSVAEDIACPADDEVREAARTLESWVRDELVLGPDHQGLGERIAELRQNGWQVRSSLTAEDPPPLRRAAAEIAALLGAPATPEQVVTFSAIGQEASVVVLDASDGQQASWSRRVQSLGGRMDSDPDFVRMAVTAG